MVVLGVILLILALLVPALHVLLWVGIVLLVVGLVLNLVPIGTLAQAAATTLANQPSGNVIAEVPGRDRRAAPILVACHLDSWDQGTGAIDDAAGCGIVTAAAKRIMDAGRPHRPRHTDPAPIDEGPSTRGNSGRGALAVHG